MVTRKVVNGHINFVMVNQSDIFGKLENEWVMSELIPLPKPFEDEKHCTVHHIFVSRATKFALQVSLNPAKKQRMRIVC